jgi:hypothetical protein
MKAAQKKWQQNRLGGQVLNETLEHRLDLA